MKYGSGKRTNVVLAESASEHRTRSRDEPNEGVAMKVLELRSLKTSGLTLALVTGLALSPGHVTRASAVSGSTQALAATSAHAGNASIASDRRYCVERANRICCTHSRWDRSLRKLVYYWMCHAPRDGGLVLGRR